VLTVKRGFLSSANFHTAFSAATLLAMYTTTPWLGSYGGEALRLRYGC
jgi:hypothetical protein